MSSTNRSKERQDERDDKQDYYITPHWAVREFLKEWNQKSPVLQSVRDEEKLVLDPCAGGDEIHDMSYPLVLKEWNIEALTLDIREDSRASIIGNYLETDMDGVKFDFIITNPPFNLALDIITKALFDCADGGNVVMLQRLNFMGTQERSYWFKENMPTDIYVHSKRMGFDPEKPGKTDSIEYAHFIWTKGKNPDYAKTYTIIHEGKHNRSRRSC